MGACDPLSSWPGSLRSHPWSDHETESEYERRCAVAEARWCGRWQRRPTIELVFDLPVRNLSLTRLVEVGTCGGEGWWPCGAAGRGVGAPRGGRTLKAAIRPRYNKWWLPCSPALRSSRFRVIQLLWAQTLSITCLNSGEKTTASSQAKR
jgi:hypothetical protein